jgi:hypothetical protein
MSIHLMLWHKNLIMIVSVTLAFKKRTYIEVDSTQQSLTSTCIKILHIIISVDDTRLGTSYDVGINQSWFVMHKVKTPYHDNDLILTPIISP